MDTRNRLEEALAQFEAALTQVEQACGSLISETEALDALRAENAQLKQAQAKLENELQTLKARAADLAEANRQVLARIDAAMSRIRKVLGEEA